jgi:amidohydrolase
MTGRAAHQHRRSLLSIGEDWLAGHEPEVVRWRRDLHAHPEVSWNEHRTTDQIVATLQQLGLSPRRRGEGTGVVCDIGDGPEFIGLRADIDALPLFDTKAVSYASQVPGVCHACGHDAHTAILLGVAAVLAEAADELPVPVRLIFQPAEERTPGGASTLVAEGVLDDVAGVFALHCDPRLDAGKVGLRSGAITAACDQIAVTLAGGGGHTARPHLTTDVVFALGKVITELPGLLSRRIDPRSSLSVVWGAVSAGSAANAIPNTGTLKGTLRMLDDGVWHDLEHTVRELVSAIVAPTGAKLDIVYDQGVPAVINDVGLVTLQHQAAIAALGPSGVAETQQSMGGEDFSWYLQTVPGAMARLGVRQPGTPGGDLHQPSFDIDEGALAVGIRFSLALLDELSSPIAQDSPQ